MIGCQAQLEPQNNPRAIRLCTVLLVTILPACRCKRRGRRTEERQDESDFPIPRRLDVLACLKPAIFLLCLNPAWKFSFSGFIFPIFDTSFFAIMVVNSLHALSSSAFSCYYPHFGFLSFLQSVSSRVFPWGSSRALIFLAFSPMF
ncbi:hypothetical protein GALMADRAFT_1141590 [Galerina marginata CBS 339.88]|uniref:Uncharacterized protein n=1 Tax=Galerina marginata (strain CBS 339.88) TaxID=685588 RepID=A0A067SJ87_GALM3|nr:hypothetical protein GALMADRAFT_1141590 [Galerina marginata CBS 339.88]